jgi:hypothetical protein
MSQCPLSIHGCSGYSRQGCTQGYQNCTPGGDRDQFPMPGFRQQLDVWSNYLQNVMSEIDNSEELSRDIEELKSSIDSLRLNIG